MTVSEGVSPSPKGGGAEPARSPSKSTTACHYLTHGRHKRHMQYLNLASNFGGSADPLARPSRAPANDRTLTKAYRLVYV